MAWLTHRYNLIAIGTITTILLLFSNSLGFQVTDVIMKTGIKWLHILAIGQLYLVYSLWKRYI